MQTVETAPPWDFGDSISPGLYSSPPDHPSDLASTPRQSTAGFGSITGNTNRNDRYESTAEASYASLQRAITAAEAAQGRFDGGFEENENDLNPLQPYAMSGSSGSSTTGPVAASAFSDWDSSGASSVVWTPVPQSQVEDPFEFHDGILPPSHLQQQQSPNQHSGYEGFHTTTDAYHLQSQPYITSFPAQLTHPQPEAQQQLCLPEPSRQPPALPAEAFSRRSSTSSELANNLGTINIQSQPPNPPHRGIVFKQPEMASLDLAARRNKRRPAALGAAALRSRSCAGPLSMSPTAMGPFLGPTTAVRRIKSTGNNLNVAHGRIQKTMPGSAQRSPLQFQSFAEIDSLNNANVLTRENTNSAQTMSSGSSLAPPTPLSPIDSKHSHLPWINTPDVQGHPFVYNPDYRDCFLPNAVEAESNITSPPTTPLNAEMLARMQQHALQHQLPPQSAPPQYTTFPQYSPPYSNGPPTNGNWLDPANSPKVYSFPPTIHMPQPLYGAPINCGDNGMVNEISHQLQLQFNNHFPQAGSHHEFQVNSAPKAPEFFFHEFPQQKQAHQQVWRQLEPHKPKNYVFANATPDDF